MPSALFLTYRMAQGYGVDVVVSQLALGFEKKGIQVAIGCIESDGTYEKSNIFGFLPRIEEFSLLIKSLNPTIVVAHTEPFFQWLPILKSEFPTIRFYAWEHGDPPPECFKNHEERTQIKHNKVKLVYPFVDGVIAISEFVKIDSRCDQAKVILLGGNHLEDLGVKDSSFFSLLRSGLRPLKIGSLMRLDQDSGNYKGGADFVRIVQRLKDSGLKIEAHIMGKGSSSDAIAFREKGFVVHLNSSEADKTSFLRSLDVFISPSKWEGFNLPLVEAQSLGTIGCAYNVGAHREVTCDVFDSEDKLLDFIHVIYSDIDTLQRKSEHAYAFVRTKLTWADTCNAAYLYLFKDEAKHKQKLFDLSAFNIWKIRWEKFKRACRF